MQALYSCIQNALAAVFDLLIIYSEDFKIHDIKDNNLYIPNN